MLQRLILAFAHMQKVPTVSENGSSTEIASMDSTTDTASVTD